VLRTGGAFLMLRACFGLDLPRQEMQDKVMAWIAQESTNSERAGCGAG